MTLVDLGTALYFACVDFLVHTASLLGVTYRDTNAALFFLLWPAVTIALVAAALFQARIIRRLRATRAEEEAPAVAPPDQRTLRKVTLSSPGA